MLAFAMYFILSSTVVLALCRTAAPATAAEQKADDDDQAQYLVDLITQHKV